MNKTVIIGVVAVVILALAGLGAFMVMSNKKMPTSTTGTTSEAMLANDNSTPKTIRELMTMTANQTCTYSDDMGNSGTLYSGGGKVRIDSASTIEGEVVNSYMLSDSANIYIWTDSGEEGFKMSLADMADFQDQAATSTNSVNLNYQVDYNCNAWAVDNSKFSMPSITFQDFGAMMQEAEAAMKEIPGASESSESVDVTAMQCAACDNLSGDAATQCRTALKCN